MRFKVDEDLPRESRTAYIALTERIIPHLRQLSLRGRTVIVTPTAMRIHQQSD
jgi:hypothetical protein